MKTALVTGANSGIGRATAARLAVVGYRVFAGMRDPGKAGKLLEMAQGASRAPEPVALDVTDAASVRTAVTRAQAAAGGIDVLVNNAGIGWNAAIEDVDIEAAKVAFDTNYWGAMRCIQAVLPGMRGRASGCIVNVSSIAGRVALLAQTVYTSSKWALECLSENLAQEVAPFGVRVVVVEPGVTRTAILPKNEGTPEPTVYGAIYRRLEQFYKKGAEANVRPEEVAETILGALDDPKRGFRYPCAWGGTELTSRRPQISDERWIALGLHGSDDDYYDDYERLFGLDLRTD